MQVGRGHTKGDTIAWIPSQRVLFSGDLVEFDATPYAGDAYFEDWPATLDALAAMKPSSLVPGRGAALKTPEQVAAAGEPARAAQRHDREAECGRGKADAGARNVVGGERHRQDREG